MKCPHCHVEFHPEPKTIPIDVDAEGAWGIIWKKCPACSRLIVELVCGTHVNASNGEDVQNLRRRFLGHPKAPTRPAPPPEVPPEFRDDFIEACLVIADSPKASAALGRRCLQHVLREMAGVQKPNLAQEIDEVIASGKLPPHLADAIDAVRNIGNFAAHPIKSTSSGEIVDVEPGEADWTLDVLEGLFDHYFIQPELLKKRRAALNAKLADAGKPLMK